MAVQVEPSTIEILHKEMSASKAGMKEAAQKIGNDVTDLVSPINWTRAHPWATLSVAAVAGFLAAAYTPTPHEVKKEATKAKTKHSLSDMFKRFMPDQNGHDEKEKSTKEATAAAPAGSSWLSTLIHEAAAMIRPVLVSMVSNSISAYAKQPSDGNPQTDSPSPTT